jgi:hypothetical protein
MTEKPALRRHRRRFFVGLFLCSLAAAGCGSGPYQSSPVDAKKARETLVVAMESWKSGETAESLKQKTPSIVVQDFDWTGGKKLHEYEVLGDGEEVDANLIARVKLILKEGEGGTVEKTVYYVVGTAPVLTVFRDAFR